MSYGKLLERTSFKPRLVVGYGRYACRKWTVANSNSWQVSVCIVCLWHPFDNKKFDYDLLIRYRENKFSYSTALNRVIHSPSAHSMNLRNLQTLFVKRWAISFNYNMRAWVCMFCRYRISEAILSFAPEIGWELVMFDYNYVYMALQILYDLIGNIF